VYYKDNFGRDVMSFKVRYPVAGRTWSSLRFGGDGFLACVGGVQVNNQLTSVMNKEVQYCKDVPQGSSMDWQPSARLCLGGKKRSERNIQNGITNNNKNNIILVTEDNPITFTSLPSKVLNLAFTFSLNDVRGALLRYSTVDNVFLEVYTFEGRKVEVVIYKGQHIVKRHGLQLENTKWHSLHFMTKPSAIINIDTHWILLELDAGDMMTGNSVESRYQVSADATQVVIADNLNGSVANIVINDKLEDLACGDLFQGNYLR